MYAPETYAPVTLPAPGWFDDPSDKGMLRWWAGDAWTDYVVDAPYEPVVALEAPALATPALIAPMVPAVPIAPDPIVAATLASAPALAPDVRYRLEAWDVPTPTGSSHNTGIWMLAVLPVIALALQFVALIYPASLDIQVAVGIVLATAAIGLPIWDRIVLRARHIPGPSLLWLLVGGPIGYLVARWVTLGRAGLRGSAPTIVFAVSSAALVALALVPGVFGA